MTHAEPLRVIIQLTPDDDRELLSRIEGQTIDLDVAVRTVELAAISADVPTQIERARKLARDRDSDVVVWFGHKSDGLIVFVLGAARDTILIRPITPPGPARDSVARAPTSADSGGDVRRRSALYEAAAVVIRSALRALAAGAAIGVATEVATARSAAQTTVTTPARPLRPPPWRWRVGLGGAASADGASPIHGGMTMWAGVEFGRWRGDIAMAGHPSVTLSDPLTTVELTRYAGWLTAAMTVGDSLAVELSAGLLGFDRRTTATSGGLSATADRATAALLVGPGMRYTRRLGRLRLEVAAAVDIVLGAPDLGYQSAGQFVSIRTQWPLQPRLTVGVSIDSQVP
ncbi:MAG: hypothetical protein AAGC55_13620 [Myxococcota bacterium]